jgi:hypothetical protein
VNPPLETPEDVLQNLRELADNDTMLRYTLQQLAKQSAASRKQILDAFKPGKVGRPSIRRARFNLTSIIEQSIKTYRPEVERQLKGQVTEKRIIVWLLQKKHLKTDIAETFRENSPSGQQAVKRIQDQLAKYRKARNASPKSP